MYWRRHAPRFFGETVPGELSAKALDRSLFFLAGLLLSRKSSLLRLEACDVCFQTIALPAHAFQNEYRRLEEHDTVREHKFPFHMARRGRYECMGRRVQCEWTPGRRHVDAAALGGALGGTVPAGLRETIKKLHRLGLFRNHRVA